MIPAHTCQDYLKHWGIDGGQAEFDEICFWIEDFQNRPIPACIIRLFGEPPAGLPGYSARWVFAHILRDVVRSAPPMLTSIQKNQKPRA